MAKPAQLMKYSYFTIQDGPGPAHEAWKAGTIAAFRQMSDLSHF